MSFSSFKETNRLTSKGISNIYLKVTIEEIWRSQNFDFFSLKSFYISFWRAPIRADIIEF